MTDLARFVSSHFFLFWTLPLLPCLALAARFTSRAEGARIGPSRAAWGPADLAAAAVLIAFAAADVFLMLYKEDFLGGDNAFFTLITLRGHPFDPPIWPDAGRYWPLGNQEFNLIRRWTRSAAGYHALPALEYLLTLACSVVLLRTRPRWPGLLVALFALTFESVTISFHGLIFPERNLVFLIAVLLVAYERRAGRHPFAASAAALTAAQLALYYKEPAFVLIGGFALAQLVHSRRAARDASLAELARARWLDVSLLMLCLYFLLLFGISGAPFGGTPYSSQRNIGSLAAGLAHLDQEPLLGALVGLFALRWTWIAFGRDRWVDVWDSAAVAAALYSGVFVGLGLWGEHYMAPAVFLLALAGGRIALDRLATRPALRSGIALAAAAATAFVNLPASARHVLERKAVIDSQVQLVEALDDDLGSRRRPLDLLFPSAPGFWIMTLGSYLDWRGYPVDEVDDGGERIPRGVTLHTPNASEQDRCVPWMPISCVSRTGPTRIHYIVILPQDPLPDPRLRQLASGSTLVFQYRPSEDAWERALRVLGGDADADVRTRLYRVNPASVP